MSQGMKLWYMYLSHSQLAKAQASLHICTVSSESSLFAHIKYRSTVDEGSDQKSDMLHWMAAYVRLKNEFTEDVKYHCLMTWLVYKETKEVLQYNSLGPLGQSDVPSDWYSGGSGLDPQVGHISFVEIRS